jgi:hypothetical protein
MAAVLEKDERVKKGITICRTCSNNIGCYCCTSSEKCALGFPVCDKRRFCCDCTLKDDHFCESCGGYLCPECYAEEKNDA